MSTPKSIRDRVAEIVKHQLNLEDHQIVDTAGFAADLGADSLDQVELVMAVEAEFKNELPNNGIIPEADAEKFVLFGDVVKYLEGKVRPVSEE